MSSRMSSRSLATSNNRTLFTPDRSGYIPMNVDYAIHTRTELTRSLIGHMVGYENFTAERVQHYVNTYWKLQENVFVQQFGRTLMFRFQVPDDVDFVRSYGPININGGLLVLDFYVPNINLRDLKIRTADIWIRIHDIPFEYFVEDNILRIANSSGEVLAIEWNSAPAYAKQYIRFKAKVPLDSPLIPGAYIRTMEGNPIWVHFKYEKIFKVSYTCGIIRHNNTQCTINERRARRMLINRLRDLQEGYNLNFYTEVDIPHYSNKIRAWPNTNYYRNSVITIDSYDYINDSLENNDDDNNNDDDDVNGNGREEGDSNRNDLDSVKYSNNWQGIEPDSNSSSNNEGGGSSSRSLPDLNSNANPINIENEGMLDPVTENQMNILQSMIAHVPEHDIIGDTPQENDNPPNSLPSSPRIRTNGLLLIQPGRNIILNNTLNGTLPAQDLEEPFDPNPEVLPPSSPYPEIPAIPVNVGLSITSNPDHQLNEGIHLHIISNDSDDYIDDEPLSREEIVNWLGDDSAEWVENLMDHFNINSITLQHLEEMYINYAMQQTWEDNANLDVILPLPDTSNARLGSYSNDWIRFASSVRKLVMGFARRESLHSEIIFDNLMLIGRNPSTDEEMEFWDSLGQRSDSSQSSNLSDPDEEIKSWFFDLDTVESGAELEEGKYSIIHQFSNRNGDIVLWIKKAPSIPNLKVTIYISNHKIWIAVSLRTRSDCSCNFLGSIDRERVFIWKEKALGSMMKTIISLKDLRNSGLKQ